ncbi:MAG TPA: hypothetical protein VND99_02895 [Candidatus Acidoferrales bacterium]|nr:hypothetical protein [Candidatus Acidoferrales bacterium]
MFKHLADLGYTRNVKEAIGFYLAYLLLLLIAGAVAGFLFGGVDSVNSFYAGVNIGTIVAVIACLILTYMIFMSKKRTKSFASLLLTLVAGFLAMIGGGILGLLIPAYLTTTGAKSKKKKK